MALAVPVAAQSPAPQADLAALQQGFQDVIRRATPSVVGLRVLRTHGGEAADSAAAGGRSFLVNGSGVVIQADGKILTNEHVVQGARSIEVIFFDGRKAPGRVVASDPRSDMAIVQATASGLTPIPLCDWSRVARGQWAVALGNPFGLAADGQSSASVGIIANLDRRLPGLGEADDRLYTDMIQTSAAINPGNSGGALLNLNGELIGLVTAMHAHGVADEGIGFAIPLSPVRRQIVERLARGESIEYGYLGLSVRSGGSELRRAATADAAGGVWVERIEPGGPAAQADLREGDRILRYASVDVRDAGHMAALVGHTPVGTRVTLDIQRGAETRLVDVTVRRRELGRVFSLRADSFPWRGARFVDAASESAQSLEVQRDVHGVVVLDVLAGTPADLGLHRGDIVVEVEGLRVRGLDQFRQAVERRRGQVGLQVHGKGPVVIGP